MRPPTQDPTAGETARTLGSRPWGPLPIHDPTDPRCEALTPDGAEPAREPDSILDPTDPEYGTVAA